MFSGGEPGPIAAGWLFSEEKALGTAMVDVPSEGCAPDRWNPGRAKVMMPADANFAVFHIMVHKLESRPGTKAVFGEQYADDLPAHPHNPHAPSRARRRTVNAEWNGLGNGSR